jgi:hypothetical protein
MCVAATDRAIFIVLLALSCVSNDMTQLFVTLAFLLCCCWCADAGRYHGRPFSNAVRSALFGNISDQSQLDELKAVFQFLYALPCFNATQLKDFCGVTVVTNRTHPSNANLTCFAFDSDLVVEWPSTDGSATTTAIVDLAQHLQDPVFSNMCMVRLAVRRAVVVIEWPWLKLPTLRSFEITDSFISSATISAGRRSNISPAEAYRIGQIIPDRFVLRNVTGNWGGTFWISSLRDTAYIDLSFNSQLAGHVMDFGFRGSTTTDSRPRTIVLHGSVIKAVIVSNGDVVDWISYAVQSIPPPTYHLPRLYIDRTTTVYTLYTTFPVQVRPGWFCANGTASLAAYLGEESYSDASGDPYFVVKVVADKARLQHIIGIDGNYCNFSTTQTPASTCAKFERDPLTGYVHGSADWARLISTVAFDVMVQDRAGSLMLKTLLNSSSNTSIGQASELTLGLCPPRLECADPQRQCLNYSLIMNTSSNAAAQVGPVQDGVSLQTVLSHAVGRSPPTGFADMPLFLASAGAGASGCERRVLNFDYMASVFLDVINGLANPQVAINVTGFSYDGCASALIVRVLLQTNGVAADYPFSPVNFTFDTTYALIGLGSYCNADKIVSTVGVFGSVVGFTYFLAPAFSQYFARYSGTTFVCKTDPSGVFTIINVNKTFDWFIGKLMDEQNATAPSLLPFVSWNTSLNVYGGYYNASSFSLVFYQLHDPATTYAFSNDQCGELSVPAGWSRDTIRMIAPSDLGWGFVQASLDPVYGSISMTRVFADAVNALQVVHQCGLDGNPQNVTAFSAFTTLWATDPQKCQWGANPTTNTASDYSQCHQVVNTPAVMASLLPCMPELSIVGREVTSITLQLYPSTYLLGMNFANDRGAVLSFVNRQTVSGDALPSTFTLAADCTMAVPGVVWAVNTHGYLSVLWRFSEALVDASSGLTLAFDSQTSGIIAGHARLNSLVPLNTVRDEDLRYGGDSQCSVGCSVRAEDCDRMAAWQALTTACIVTKGGEPVMRLPNDTCSSSPVYQAVKSFLGLTGKMLAFGCTSDGQAITYGVAGNGVFVELPFRAMGFDGTCSACVPLLSTVTYPSPLLPMVVAAVFNFVLVIAAQYFVPRWVRDQLIKVPVFVASPLLGFLGVGWRREDLLRHARNVRECTFVSAAERERLLQRHVMAVQACVDPVGRCVTFERVYRRFVEEKGATVDEAQLLQGHAAFNEQVLLRVRELYEACREQDAAVEKERDRDDVINHNQGPNGDGEGFLTSFPPSAQGMRSPRSGAPSPAMTSPRLVGGGSDGQDQRLLNPIVPALRFGSPEPKGLADTAVWSPHLYGATDAHASLPQSARRRCTTMALGALRQRWVRLDTEAEVTWRPFDVLGRWVDAKVLLPGVGLMWVYVVMAAMVMVYEASSTNTEARDRRLSRWAQYQLFYFKLLNSSQVMATVLVNAALRVVYAPMRAEATLPEVSEKIGAEDHEGAVIKPPAISPKRLWDRASHDPFLVLSIALVTPALVTHIVPFCVYYAVLPAALLFALALTTLLTWRFTPPGDVVDRHNRYVVRAVVVRAIHRIVAQVGTALVLQLAFNYAALTYTHEADVSYDGTMRSEWEARSLACWVERWSSGAHPALSLLP